MPEEPGNEDLVEADRYQQALLALRRIALQLNYLGFERALFSYDGSGDSGEIDFFEVEPEGIPWSYPDQADDVMKLAEDYVYTVLYELFAGWENNEGAHGEISLDCITGHLVLSHTSREYYEVDGPAEGGGEGKEPEEDCPAEEYEEDEEPDYELVDGDTTTVDLTQAIEGAIREEGLLVEQRLRQEYEEAIDLLFRPRE